MNLVSLLIFFKTHFPTDICSKYKQLNCNKFQPPSHQGPTHKKLFIAFCVTIWMVQNVKFSSLRSQKNHNDYHFKLYSQTKDVSSLQYKKL